MLHTTLRNFTRRGASLRTITTAALRKRTTVHIAAANSLTRNVGVGAVLHPFPAVTSSQLFQTRSFASEGDVIEQPVPSMGDSITEGTLVEWAKDIGEYCAADDIVAVIETDKVSLDVRTDKAGTLESTLAEVDETVAVGAPLYTLKLGGDAPAVAESAPAAAVPAAAAAAAPTPAAAPAAAAAVAPAAPAPAAAAPPAMAPPTVAGARTESRTKINRMRQAISRRLKESQNTAAALTTFNEVDMSAAMNLRKEYKDEFFETHGVKLGFMSIFSKACAEALKEIPAINAAIDDETQEIVYRDYVDISIAVSSPRGLVVPVVRNVESMDMLGIEATIAELGRKARNDDIALEDMAGGTFTISNGGVFGSMMGTPIINMPQSGILGMHGIKQRPVVVDGEIVARPMMYIALTYDHRLVDGREAVTFLCSVRDKVEDPRRMLLGL